MATFRNTSLRWLALALCAVLLVVFLLLPQVRLMSMSLPMAEVMHKLPRLVHGEATRTVAHVLFAGMLAAPLLVAAAIALRKSRRLVALLPAAFALLLAVALMTTDRPVAPAYGLWLYLALALLLAALTTKKR